MTPLADAFDKYQRAINNYKEAQRQRLAPPGQAGYARRIFQEAEEGFVLCLAEYLMRRRTTIWATPATEPEDNGGNVELTEERERNAHIREPESMNVGQLNQAVRDLRELLYQKQLLLQTEQQLRQQDRAALVALLSLTAQ